jgi:transcriptional regulator with XRE-family HTH domain
MQDEKARKAFGKRLQALRKHKRLTQKETAAQIRTALSQYNKYEYGLHYPTTEKLLLLANLYNTTTDYLLTGNISENNPLTNMRLIKRLKELEKLNIDDQETAIKILDAIIMQNKVQGAITPLDKKV